MKTIDIILSGIAFGGDAVGRHEGKAIFVPYGIPGEYVRVQITHDKGRFARAEIIEILKASPHRCSAPCSHYGICGGCHFQHVSTAAQLEYKQQIVTDQLSRIAGLREVIVHPTIASPSAYNYRSHVTLQVDQANRLSFTSTGSGKRLVPIENCLLMRPELCEYFSNMTVNNTSERLRLQVGSSGEPIAFWINRDQEDEASQSISDRSEVEYRIKHRQFRCSAGSFFQVNLPQAEVMVDYVLKRLNLTGKENLLDLYAGVGLFTAFLAEQAREVHAVEISPSAVHDAKFNLAEFNNVTIHEGMTEHILPTLNNHFDAVVLDPPRAGMHPHALSSLLKLKPGRIIYVSCDPATLARDAKLITEAGFRLVDAQPIEMFPQTYHIETVVVFSL